MYLTTQLISATETSRVYAHDSVVSSKKIGYGARTFKEGSLDTSLAPNSVVQKSIINPICYN